MTRRRTVTIVAAVLLLAGCASGGVTSGAPAGTTPTTPAPSASTATDEAHEADAAAPAARPLRAGERFETLTVPGGAYTPSAPAGSMDDYHCFLLDPGLTRDTFVTGTDVLPGNSDVVHHAILFRVEPGQVAQAEAHDAATAGRGWTCFGGSALPNTSGNAISALDSAPWLAAWAPGGGEAVLGRGTGMLLPKGSRVVLQVHYNLREGTQPDRTRVRLRLARDGARLQALHTMLLVAPVELPCTPDESGPLCDRARALADLSARFGNRAGATVSGLQLLCGGSLTRPRAGPTQRCDRAAPEAMRVRAVAGHMHLLGRSISVTLDPGGPNQRRLLDRKVWDFDDQHATPLRRPVLVRAGEALRVTCTHDAGLRSMLPELQGLPPRYVTWGEGTSDEMCLGIVMYTDA
ncbi:MAG: monooxygenase [Sporichthyaceae bacterium]